MGDAAPSGPNPPPSQNLLPLGRPALRAGSSPPSSPPASTPLRTGSPPLPSLSRNTPAIAGGVPVRPRERYLVFGAPVLGEAERAAVLDCFNRAWIGTGPKAAEFERRFADFKGVPHAVAVNSCTAALHLSLAALGIGPGDEVVLSAMTFCSAANAVRHVGATPVLADCDPRTMNLTADTIAPCLSPRTRAVMVVHLAGRCCDMDPILALTAPRNLPIVEDCAHAVEATSAGRPAGTMGAVGCFSFYATKNVTTAEGGMVVTRDAAIANAVRTLANHGMDANAWRRFSDEGYRHYNCRVTGYKFNMPDLCAAIGLAQMDRIAAHAARRTEIWHRYDAAFADLPLDLPPPPATGDVHARHLYTPLLRLNELRCTRDQFLEALSAEHIGAGVHYLPVNWHDAHRDAPTPGGDAAARDIGERTVSLPLTGGMSDGDVLDVCVAVQRVLRYFAR